MKRAPRFALSSTSPTLSLFFFSDSVAVHRTGLDLPLPAAMFSCWTKPKSAGASLNFVFSRRQNRPTKPKQGSAADLHRRLNESIGARGCSVSSSSTNSELLLEAPRAPADKALCDSAADSYRRRQLDKAIGARSLLASQRTTNLEQKQRLTSVCSRFQYRPKIRSMTAPTCFADLHR